MVFNSHFTAHHSARRLENVQEIYVKRQPLALFPVCPLGYPGSSPDNFPNARVSVITTHSGVQHPNDVILYRYEKRSTYNQSILSYLQ